MAEKSTTAKPTAVSKALDLLANLETVKQEAVNELLAQRQEIDATLSKLGYSPAAAPKKQKAPADSSEKVCKICGEKGHDGRFHRGEKKKAVQK